MATAELAVGQRAQWTAARIGGIAGLGFAAGVILQNAVLLSSSPAPGAGLEEIVRFYTDSSTRVMISNGLVATNAVFFLIFVSVITSRLGEHAESAIWGRIAYAAGIALLPIFATVAFLQVVLVTRIAELQAEPAVLSLLWELHSAAFAMTGIALGALLCSLSIGALTAKVVPGWTAGLGIIGGVLLLTSGAFAFNMIDGGPALFIGFAGFATWVLWLVAASIRLLRTSD